MARVLLIEDDGDTAQEIVAELNGRGFTLDWAATGFKGLEKARAAEPDAMIVDCMLPDMDGRAVVATLRRDQVRTPVLILSALRAVDDRVLGLNIGGDDYLIKPFEVAELVARLEALLRRGSQMMTTMCVGPLELDLLQRKAKRGTRSIDLLPREFHLLEYMMRHKDQLLTRGMLLERIWNYRFIPQTNLVDVHIGRLRRKVDEAEEMPMIHTVRGLGFILRAPV